MKEKQIKRIITILLLVSIILCPGYVKADDEEEEEIQDNEIQELIVESSTEAVEEPIINARAAVIYDRTTKKIMWGKNENTKKAMASTTKIMTATVVLEKANLSDMVTISKKAAGTGGSRLKINTGDKITVRDLMYGLMLRSRKWCSSSFSRTCWRKCRRLCGAYEKAKELGLTQTHFVTPHGLDNEEHYTTAYELAKLTDYALQNKTFAQIVNSKTYTITINGIARNLYNTNELLGVLSGVDGVKTGFTGNAGRCLVTSTTRNGNQIIVVVLGADTKKQRTSDSSKLIEYAFKNYERVNIEEMVKKEFENWKQINSKRIYINKAQNNSMELQVKQIQNKIIPIKKGEQKDIHIEIHAIYQYEAPIDKDTKIGEVIVKKKEEIIESTDIVCQKEIYKKNVWDYWVNMLNSLNQIIQF